MPLEGGVTYGSDTDAVGWVAWYRSRHRYRGLQWVSDQTQVLLEVLQWTWLQWTQRFPGELHHLQVENSYLCVASCVCCCDLPNQNRMDSSDLVKRAKSASSWFLSSRKWRVLIIPSHTKEKRLCTQKKMRMITNCVDVFQNDILVPVWCLYNKSFLQLYETVRESKQS